ncbi:MAG TPA: DsbE family thiol:disulfide interchange protein [Gammaproteobacteria bacterium]|nr:DsbE family thiol:disulfide interchange protein [Gammaproteobacteria bacterium]
MNFRNSAPFIIPGLVLIFLIGLFARGLFLDPTRVKSPLIGKPAPKFSLPGLYDPTQRFDQSLLQGKVSLFNVWGAWCVACQEEHPVLVAFAQRKVLPIYGLDYHDDRQAALDMLHKDGDPYTQILDDATGDVAINWGVYGAPETFLIDKQGVIRDKIIGPLTPDIIDKQLMPEIQKLQVEAP